MAQFVYILLLLILFIRRTFSQLDRWINGVLLFPTRLIHVEVQKKIDNHRYGA